jgi:hypothetical protein
MIPPAENYGQSTAAAASGYANWQKAPTFGKPLAPTDFQTPRTLAISFGIRF